MRPAHALGRPREMDMFLLEEIVVEIVMIAAVVVAVSCLAYVTQLSIREQVYLRRLRRERTSAESATPALLEERRPGEAAAAHDRAAVLPQKHV